MKNSKQFTKGFTLIELLVVLVILGITLSFVAPDMYKTFQQTQQKNELAKINQIIELSRERSFFSQNIIELHFNGDQFIVSENMVQRVGYQLADKRNNSVIGAEPVKNKKQLKALTSQFFTFEDTLIKLKNGSWQGGNTVNLLSSPNGSLTQLVINRMIENTK